MNAILRAVVAFVLITGPATTAQSPAAVPESLRELFQAGQYQPVIDAAASDANPAVVYLAALSHQKLNETEPLQVMAGRLAGRPDDDPWHFIGLSVRQLAGGEVDAAQGSAEMAVARDGMLPQAHYQLGLVLAKREAWREAAVAFDKAGELEPQDAYAFYYGGLSHYRAGRRDLMAVRFERFLKLAPDAPERPEVQQIMRMIRGR